MVRLDVLYTSNHGSSPCEQTIMGSFRWNTRKMVESERFSYMFETSIGIVKPNREFVLCEKVA